MADKLAEARALYAAAGYSAARPLQFELRYNSGEAHNRLAVAVAGMWKEALGAQAKLSAVEFKVLQDDVRARRMFPVHWGTFNLAFHDWDEPIRRAVAAARAGNVDLLTPRVGEWVDADQPFADRRWW